MKTDFKTSYKRDFKKITDQRIRDEIKKIEKSVEKARSPGDIPKMKKIVGFKDTYRIKFGVYRIRIEIKKDLVVFTDVGRRDKIYNSLSILFL